MRADPHKLAARAGRVGMVINLMLPAGVALLAYAIEASGAVPKWEMTQSGPPIIFILVGALALAELAAAFFIRRKFFSREHVAPFRTNPAAIDQWLLKSSIIVFTLGGMPILYGAVLYVFSGDIRQLAFFGIVSMLAYRFFRPTADQLEDILQDREPAT